MLGKEKLNLKFAEKCVVEFYHAYMISIFLNGQILLSILR